MCSGVSGDGPLHAVRRCGSVRQRDHRVGLEHSYMGSRVHAGPVRRHLRHVVGGEPRQRHVSRSVKPTVRLRSGRWRRGDSWCRSLVSQLWSTRSRSTRREARSSLPPMMAFHACGVHKVLSKSTSARVRRRYGASDWERNRSSRPCARPPPSLRRRSRCPTGHQRVASPSSTRRSTARGPLQTASS